MPKFFSANLRTSNSESILLLTARNQYLIGVHYSACKDIHDRNNVHRASLTSQRLIAYDPDNGAIEEFTLSKAEFTFVQIAITTSIITAAIAATMMPYSTAVAPLSSFINLASHFINLSPPLNLEKFKLFYTY